MTIDEFDFRDLCRDLEASYSRLGRLRDARPRPPEVRSALKPAPGPQAPGNGVAVWTLIDCETRLRQVAFNALGDIGVKLVDGDGRAFRLCQLMAFNAAAISALGWADDLMDELQDQDRKLTRAVARIEPQETDQPRPEPWQVSEVIITSCKERGLTVTRTDLDNWIRAGKITTKKRGNRNTYRLTEVLKCAKP